jgi:hypothetical protein
MLKCDFAIILCSTGYLISAFKMPTKKLIKKKSFFAYYCGTYTSFFTNKKSKRSRKTVEIKGYLTILLEDGRIRVRIREAKNLKDPDSVADPDPNPDPRVFGPPGSGSISQTDRDMDPDPEPDQDPSIIKQI